MLRLMLRTVFAAVVFLVLLAIVLSSDVIVSDGETSLICSYRSVPQFLISHSTGVLNHTVVSLSSHVTFFKENE